MIIFIVGELKIFCKQQNKCLVVIDKVIMEIILLTKRKQMFLPKTSLERICAGKQTLFRSTMDLSHY